MTEHDKAFKFFVWCKGLGHLDKDKQAERWANQNPQQWLIAMEAWECFHDPAQWLNEQEEDFE